VSDRRFQRDPGRPCFVISVAANLVQAHPRTLRIYEDEGLLAPARTPTNIRLYSENDIRRILWIRRLTQERGVNLAGVKLLFELEERIGTRILEALFDDDQAREAGAAASSRQPQAAQTQTEAELRAAETLDGNGYQSSDEDRQTTRPRAPVQSAYATAPRQIHHIAITRPNAGERASASVNANSGDSND
jgi:MerR family transcriptional regulator/heat shock protein HspR